MNRHTVLRMGFALGCFALSSPIFANSTPNEESVRIDASFKRLDKAIHNPEYMLENWIALPESPKPRSSKPHFLSLREAILLALRYNPTIQNAELDRIIQRYNLRLAENEFELQFALAGTAWIE